MGCTRWILVLKGDFATQTSLQLQAPCKNGLVLPRCFIGKSEFGWKWFTNYNIYIYTYLYIWYYSCLLWMLELREVTPRLWFQPLLFFEQRMKAISQAYLFSVRWNDLNFLLVVGVQIIRWLNRILDDFDHWSCLHHKSDWCVNLRDVLVLGSPPCGCLPYGKSQQFTCSILRMIVVIVYT